MIWIDSSYKKKFKQPENNMEKKYSTSLAIVENHTKIIKKSSHFG